MNFPIGNKKDYSAHFHGYDPPIKIGHFSTDSENKFHDDDHQMKYLSIPKNLRSLYLDLNYGYDKYIGEYHDEEDPYHKILRWIISHKEEVRNLFPLGDSQKKEIHFVCHRSNLLRIMPTLYEKFNDWMIYATKFRSVIYLCGMETEKQEEYRKSLTDNQRREMSWGYKFEQYITTDSIDSKPNTSLPVNVNEKFFAVMKGKLGNHIILLSGETDAVDPEVISKTNDPKSMSRFVEIKTNNVLSDERKENNFRWKMLKLYLQSFIAGIPRLICGFKNKVGIVQEIKIYNISELPEMAKGLWSPDVCFNFGSHFLDFVKKCVVKDDPKVVYKFYWAPGKPTITCEELSPKYQFLPEWYIKEMSTL